MAIPKPHRPSYQPPAALEALAQRSDPIERLHAAHETAAVLIRAGHDDADPELVRRLITVVDEVGITPLADLWEERPATSLPGALFRLYVLRQWLRATPEEVALEFDAGHDVLPGTAESTSPEAVCRLADEILHGAFTGDVGDALDRAAYCCIVVAAGRRAREGAKTAYRAEQLQALGHDLASCATLWRRGELA